MGRETQDEPVDELKIDNFAGLEDVDVSLRTVDVDVASIGSHGELGKQ